MLAVCYRIAFNIYFFFVEQYFHHETIYYFGRYHTLLWVCDHNKKTYYWLRYIYNFADPYRGSGPVNSEPPCGSSKRYCRPSPNPGPNKPNKRCQSSARQSDCDPHWRLKASKVVYVLKSDTSQPCHVCVCYFHSSRTIYIYARKIN